MKKFYIISFFAILIIITGFLSLQPKVQAQSTSSAVSGTATITNTGYSIYFSGSNGGTSGNISYSVQYDPSTGFSGYGWSPEYGWIHFTGSSATVPSFVGMNDTEKSVDWANGAISLSGFNGGTSGNMPYGVTFDPTTGTPISHWAWGGNVIGWVDFSGVTVLPTGTPSCTLTATPSSINSGDSSVISWYGSNLVVNKCTASNGSGLWAGANKPTSGAFSISPSTTTTYNLSCLGNGGTNATCSVAVTVVNCSTNPIYPTCCMTNPPTTQPGLSICAETDLCPGEDGFQTYADLPCPTAVDVCPNMIGNQPTLPIGMYFDVNGNCQYTNYPNCTVNGILDNSETGIDCGGPNCPACNKIPHYKEN